jgi:hypothetical protein
MNGDNTLASSVSLLGDLVTVRHMKYIVITGFTELVQVFAYASDISGM